MICSTHQSQYQGIYSNTLKLYDDHCNNIRNNTREIRALMAQKFGLAVH